MRRLVILAVAGLAALVAGGCGASHRAATSNATVQALSYFSPTSPVVAQVQTAKGSASLRQAEAIERSNPTYAAAVTAVFAQLSQMGIDYNRDVRPLFGHPIAVGAAGTSASGAPSSFLIVWVTTSGSKLKALIGKVHGLTHAGSHDGASLYSGGGAALAVSGATLLVSQTTATLDAALDRHAAGHGVTAADYARAIAGVSPNGVVTVFGDLRGALSSSTAATARLVPWVAAITGYGASVTGSAHAVTVRFHVATNGRPLTTSELPIASGATAPSTAGTLPLQLAVRDPAQIIQFVLGAERATSPASYARFLRQEAALKRRTGVDVNALVGMLTGDLNVESDTHTTLARVQASHPAAVADMLAKLASSKPGAGSGLAGPVHRLGAGMYSFKSSGNTMTVGVIGNQLVLGRAPVSALRAFASAPTVTTSSGTGSVTFRIALGQLLAMTLKHAPSGTEQQVLAMLGDLTGSAGATTGGLTGTATLGIK